MYKYVEVESGVLLLLVRPAPAPRNYLLSDK